MTTNTNGGEAPITYVYAVHCSSADFTHVYSTLEAAMAAENDDRNKDLNPDEFSWEHIFTDMEGVEQWRTTYILFDRTEATVWITKWPLDHKPEDLAGS